MTNIEFSSETTDKIKQAINEFKNTLETYFKENSIEIKTWKFAVENNESGYTVDAAVKVQIKPKEKSVEQSQPSNPT